MEPAATVRNHQDDGADRRVGPEISGDEPAAIGHKRDDGALLLVAHQVADLAFHRGGVGPAARDPDDQYNSVGIGRKKMFGHVDSSRCD